MTTDKDEKQIVTIEPKHYVVTDEQYCAFYKCPKCRKHEIQEGFKYCPMCGRKLKWKIN